MSLSMSNSQTAAEDAHWIDCVPAPSLAPSLGPAQLSKFREEGFLVLPAAPPPKRARVLPVVPADPTPGDWCRLCGGVSTSQAFLPRPGIVPGTPVAETPPPETQEDTFLYRARVEAEADLEAGNTARLFDLGIDVEAVGGAAGLPSTRTSRHRPRGIGVGAVRAAAARCLPALAARGPHDHHLRRRRGGLRRHGGSVAPRAGDVLP